MTNKVNTWLRVIAGLELFAAMAGVGSLIFMIIGLAPSSAPLLLVYSLLTLGNLVAGILLWRLQYWGIVSSLLLQLAQVPYYASVSNPYHPLGLTFTYKQGWFAHDGVEAHEIGVNLFAIVLFLVLLRCERLWQPSADYQQMGQDTKREAEALEWSEAMVGDVADEG